MFGEHEQQRIFRDPQIKICNFLPRCIVAVVNFHPRKLYAPNFLLLLYSFPPFPSIPAKRSIKILVFHSCGLFFHEQWSPFDSRSNPRKFIVVEAQTNTPALILPFFPPLSFQHLWQEAQRRYSWGASIGILFFSCHQWFRGYWDEEKEEDFPGTLPEILLSFLRVWRENRPRKEGFLVSLGRSNEAESLEGLWRARKWLREAYLPLRIWSGIHSLSYAALMLLATS